jgi:CHAT domain-containing protein
MLSVPKCTYSYRPQPVESTALDPPRLTWCPTGPTSFFPLHAAGRYDSKERGSKIYEYVASSYTPTLTILADANVALSREPEPFKGILAVSQPNVDGQTPIPQTVEEVEALIGAVDGTIPLKWLNGPSATKEAVLSGMQSSNWVHLACHARQYPLNASESAFMLANGETLSLADISAHVSADGELAFLSACQTAAGDFDLSEEGVHLAAGMLVAGYRSVIATTWSVYDKDAPIVAEAVYRRLLQGGQVSRTGTALALHHATRILREMRGEDKFLRWAPFIHLGV